MKWFQHHSNAKDDIKLKRLRKKYGLSGIGCWWCLVEIVASEGIGGYLEFKKYPKEDMADEWGLPADIFEEMLNFMADIGLVDSNCIRTAINIPAIIDKADDFTKQEERKNKIEAERTTKKVRSGSEVTSTAENAPRHFISIFINKHKEYIGTGYLPSWGRDCKLMKELLIAYGENDLTAIIEEFFKASEDSDTWWADKVSIPVLKSCAYSVVGRLRKKK